METDKKSILWNLRNGGQVAIEHIDGEDFGVAGIDIEELSDGQLWAVIESMKIYLMETLSDRINGAIVEKKEIYPMLKKSLL